MNPLDWAGLAASAALIAACAIWIAVRAQYRQYRRYRLRELTDLERSDIDPDWEQVRQTLGPDPRK
jgi:hypothetical protein